MNAELFNEKTNNKAQEFRKYLPVNVNLSFESLEPYISLCEQKYIKPVLGERFFKKLVDYYENENNDNEKMNVVLDNVQFALVRLAYFSGYDELSVQMSDMGAASKIDKEQRLFRYQEENLKESLKEKGFNQIDIVLQYLEENKDDFPDYDVPQSVSIIKTTAVFNSVYNINNSRLVFLKMKYYISDVENIPLANAIGHNMIKELINADINDDKYNILLTFIRKYIVYASIVDGISELHKLPTEKGLIYETMSGEVNENIVQNSQINKTKQQFAQKADRYLSSAINYLKTHKKDFPAFAEHIVDSCDYPTTDVIYRDNNKKKTFFA